jgi:hypothetical protein
MNKIVHLKQLDVSFEFGCFSNPSLCWLNFSSKKLKLSSEFLDLQYDSKEKKCLKGNKIDSTVTMM